MIGNGLKLFDKGQTRHIFFDIFFKPTIRNIGPIGIAANGSNAAIIPIGS